MKQLGPIENTVFIIKQESPIGEYKDPNDVRYNLTIAKQVFMPDTADESIWEAIEGVDKYCEKYNLMHDPLKDEEIEHIISNLNE